MTRIRLDDADSIRSERGVEYERGCLRFLPVKTEEHQEVTGFFYRLIREHAMSCTLGKVHFCGLRVRTGRLTFREPDVSFLRREHYARRKGRYWEAADLVVEVVSDDDPNRDWVKKKREYAEAGIPEYWIADPRDKTLTIFTLDSGATAYREAGRYREGETARSVLLDGLTVDVTAAFTHE